MKKNICVFCLIFLFLSFGILPNRSSQVEEQVSHTDLEPEKQVYYPNVAVGPYQKVGSLNPILTKRGQEATEAVILIPGLNSVKLKNEMYEWLNFWETWKRSKIEPQIKNRYRLFVFRYDGWDSLHTSSETLALGIHQLLAQEPNIKTISFIGYSQGGMIPRVLFTKDPEIDLVTNKVITFAAPHQGAIVLTEKLVHDSIKMQPLWVQIKNFQLLDLFTNWYKFAYREQAWNNFDDGVPASAHYKIPQEALDFPNPPSPAKFITYASYFYPPVARDFEDRYGLFWGEMIPRLLLDRRSGMKELNRWTSKKVYKDEPCRFRDHLRLNDGVTPLASGLWARVCKPGEKPSGNWQKLFPNNDFCPNTPLQRAFFGADHLRWREPVSGTQPVSDQLHPEQPPKSLYHWAIYDLTGTDLN